MALMVLSGKGVNLLRKVRITVHQDINFPKLAPEFLPQIEPNSNSASAKF
jgi:hypothetical protein